MKVIRNKLEKYLSAQEGAQLAERSRDWFEHELLIQLDQHLGEQLVYLSQSLPKVMNPLSLQKEKDALDELR